jgi:hypothetical protein
MISTSVKLVDGHPEVVATTDINLVAAATALIPALRSRSSETDALVSCLVNRFRKWRDLWRPPKLCGFC